jgi:hypothetical protein
VHRLPERSRLDVLRLQRQADPLGVVDEDAREPAVARPVGGFRHELDLGQQLPIALVDPAASGDALGEHLELRASDSGEEVGEPVVEPQLGVLVVSRRLPRLGGELAGVGDPGAVVREEGAAAARRDHLVPVEREGGNVALTSGRTVLVGRAEGLGCILDEWDSVPLAHHPDRVVVAALAVQVDRDDGGDLPLGERPGEELWIEGPRLGGRVHEDRGRADVADRIGARRERERRAGDLVARADSEDDEREVEGRRAARERERVVDSGLPRKLRLEGVHVRPERSDPVGVDRIPQELEFSAGQVWGREENPRHRVASLSTAPASLGDDIITSWQTARRG